MNDILKSFGKLILTRRLWLILYLVKALTAAVFILPFYLVADSYLSSSLYSRRLLNDWDLSVLIEMFGNHIELVPVFLLFGLTAAIVFLMITQFLNGGIYYLAVSGKLSPVNWSEFWKECGCNFKAHLKITAMMIAVYLVLLVAGLIFVNLIGMAGGKLVGRSAMYMAGAKALILLAIMTASTTFSDAVRAAITTKPEGSFREWLRNGSDFFRPRVLQLAGVYFLTYLPFLVIWMLVENLALLSVGALGSVLGIFLEFILFQICSFARSGQKLWYLFILGGRFRSASPGRFLPQQAELGI